MKNKSLNASTVSRDLLAKYSQVFIPGSMGVNAAVHFKDRRERLISKLDSLAVFPGIQAEPGHDMSWFSSGDEVIQDPSLLYLTGINQLGVILALTPKMGTKAAKSTLFMSTKDLKREFWDGARLGVDQENPGSAEEILLLTGVDEVFSLDDFDGWMEDALLALQSDHLYGYFHEYLPKFKVSSDHTWKFRARLNRLKNKVKPDLSLKSCAELHLKDRVQMDEPQLKDIKKAQTAAKTAFTALLKQWSTLKTEREISAFVEYQLKLQTDQGLAFPTICAGGENAGILHYMKNDQPVPANGMLLLDFGARVGHGFSDISRTVPKNGKFNPLQRLLYEIVLDVQKTHEKRVKPGARLGDLNKKVWADLEDKLHSRFTAEGGEMQRVYPAFQKARDKEKGFAPAPHGVSHLIGWQVHEGDPFRLYQTTPLRPGMMLSNEPGLYGVFKMRIEGRLYHEAIGIRIEDDLLVTEKGCRNLSRAIPKEVDELENIMKTGA